MFLALIGQDWPCEPAKTYFSKYRCETRYEKGLVSAFNHLLETVREKLGYPSLVNLTLGEIIPYAVDWYIVNGNFYWDGAPKPFAPRYREPEDGPYQQMMEPFLAPLVEKFFPQTVVLRGERIIEVWDRVTSEEKTAHLLRLDMSNFLASSNLEGVNLSRLMLRGANLDEANLGDCNLSRANLSQASLARANLHVADLSCAILYRANLVGADLSESSLKDAMMAYSCMGSPDEENEGVVTSLRRTDLKGVTLLGANLRGCDLREANLSEANLRGACLGGADLRGADLRKAKLDEATDMHGTLLEGAKVE